MNPIEMLIDGAVQHEVLQNKNPYLTMETIILRLYKKISQYTRVQFYQNEKTLLFVQYHDEILNAYESIKSRLSHEERATVERVLSRDCPHPNELLKFTCTWYKHDPASICRWFAVDGIINLHPKYYVQDAFNNNFEKHNAAVRALYTYYSNPESIKLIVSKALDIEGDETYEADPDMDRCLELYVTMVGEEEMKRVAEDRRTKLRAQQQPNKRKRKIQPLKLSETVENPIVETPESPRPISPQNE